MASGEDLYDENAKRFFKEIGLYSADERVEAIEIKSKRMRERNMSGSGWSPGARRKGLLLPNTGSSAASPLSSRRQSITGVLPVIPNEGVQQSEKSPLNVHKVHSARDREGARLHAMYGVSVVRKSQLFNVKVSPPTVQRKSTVQEDRIHSDMEEARKLQGERKHKFREELMDDMRQHEVYLMPRPTPQELADEKKSYSQERSDVAELNIHRRLHTFRRSHQKVVVGSDEREIRDMPNHKLCISESLKRSLSKMRENLFQRRLNLTVFEKGVEEWSMPDVFAEVKKRRRDEKRGFNRQWTEKEYEDARKEGRPRPCMSGCGFQATSLDTACCRACLTTGKHGPKCERLPMPGMKLHMVTLTEGAKKRQQMGFNERELHDAVKVHIEEKQEKGEKTGSAPISHGGEESKGFNLPRSTSYD